MEAKSYKGHYGAHWLFLLLTCAAAGMWLHGRRVVPIPAWTPPNSTATKEQVDWFYVIKMPEITTQHESGVDTMKMRLTQWLETLTAAGFQPMLLSDALQAIRSGKGVPERTVVTVFNPGYRRTYEIVGPILAQLRWPAVWLSDETAMKRADRRLITFHTADKMKASGLWDIGLERDDRQFRLESGRGAPMQIGDAAHPSWTISGGAFAVNHGAALHDMHFLTVNSAWLAQELLNRLLVETPPTGKQIYLTKGVIQGREWGMTLPVTNRSINPTFDLKAPLNRRGSRLFFLGTRGYPNYNVHVECGRLVGEFWIQLRVDDVKKNGINVIYTDKASFVVQQLENAKSRLYFAPHAMTAVGKGFTGDLTLQGETLTVSFNNAKPWTLKNMIPPAEDHGIVQIYIADKPHGTAKADGVKIQFTPL